MNLLKHPRLFSLVLFSMLAVGLFFILQTDMDNASKENTILPPGVTAPEGQGAGLPSIIPSDRQRTKIEYRNISFRRDSSDKALGSVAARGAEFPEL